MDKQTRRVILITVHTQRRRAYKAMGKGLVSRRALQAEIIGCNAHLFNLGILKNHHAIIKTTRIGY